jgi:hypothetical protein
MIPPLVLNTGLIEIVDAQLVVPTQQHGSSLGSSDKSGPVGQWVRRSRGLLHQPARANNAAIATFHGGGTGAKATKGKGSRAVGLAMTFKLTSPIDPPT